MTNYSQNPNPWPYQSYSRPNYWEQRQFQGAYQNPTQYQDVYQDPTQYQAVYQDPRQFQSAYQDPRQYQAAYQDPTQFQPYPGQAFQGPRGVTQGQYFGPPQEGYYSQRPSMWGNINQMMTTAGKISNGVNTLRQMGSVLSSFRRLP